MLQITYQNVYQTSTTAGFKVGERAVTPDGRAYTYVKAQSAIASGNVVIPAATTSVGTTISSSTDSQGRIVYITKASAGWTVGAFADAYIHIDGGTGTGQVAKVKSNTNDTIELYPENALATALDGTSTMEIWQQNFVRKSAITSKIQNAVGVAQIAFAADEFGWVLTRGVGRVLAGEVLTVGGSFVTGDDTTGQVVKGITAKGAFDEQTIGTCLNANSAADTAALVFVTLS